MLKEGHVGMSLLLASPFALIAVILSQPIVAIIIYAGAIIGSGLPDIDQYIGIVKHRGFTHTVWFGIIFGIASGILMMYMLQTIPIGELIEVTYAQKLLLSIAWGLASSFGILTHLVGDMITPMGIRPFNPISPRGFIPIEISDKKYTHEIKKDNKGNSRTASDELLNSGFLAIGSLLVIITFGVGVYTGNILG